MPRITTRIFWLYFILIAITGSLGLQWLETINFRLVVLLPLFLSLLIIWSKQAVYIDKQLLILMLAYFALSFLSAFFSQDYFQTQRELIILFSSLYLMLFGILYQKDLMNGLPRILIGLGIFFSLYFLALSSLPIQLGWLMPHNGYNLVFPTYQFHNHLGDYLVLPILILLNNLFKPNQSRWYFGWLLIFCLLLIVSYSRSSYTALIGSLLILVWHLRKQLNFRLIMIIILLVAVIGLFLIITIKETNTQINWLSAVASKPLFHGRNQYWQTAIKSISDYPLFGIGAGNFLYAMGRYHQSPFDWTESSLNLFLNQATENGILVLLSFIAFIFWVFKNNHRNLSLFLLIALLINFQTDYTFKIIPMWLLFWLIVGLNIKKNNHFNLEIKQIAIPIIIGLIFFGKIILGEIFSQMRLFNIAILLDPLNKTNREILIAQNLISNRHHWALFDLWFYQKLFRADAQVQYNCGYLYTSLGYQQQALIAYRQAYLWNPFTSLELYRRIYYLERKINGQKSARQFLSKYQNKVKQIKDKTSFSQQIRRDWKQFQQTINE